MADQESMTDPATDTGGAAKLQNTWAEGLEALAEPIDSVQLLPGNPRVGNVDAIADALRRFGQRKPIVVNRSDRVVLAGNHTLQAARQLGWDRIAVAWVDDDEATAKAFALADNRTGDLGSYDDEALAAMIREVGDLDAALLLDTGWDEESVDELLASLEPEQLPPAMPSDADDVPTSAPAKTARGDVWLLGPHRLMCGDCRDFGDVERALDGRRVDVAFTSPPYASQRAYDEGSEFRPIRPDEYVDWFEGVQANVRAALSDTGSWFVNIKEHCEDGQRHLYVKDLTLAHVRRWGWMFVDEFCWVDSRNGVPGGWSNRFKDAWEPVFHYSAQNEIRFNPLANGTPSGDVFDYSPDTAKARTGSGLLGSEKATPMREGLARPSNVIVLATSSGSDHPAMFPVALPEWFIRAYSDEGDVVYDPFLGSGSTLIAAHRQGRVAVGMEISPKYCDIICRRWQEATGDKPIAESTGVSHDFTQEA